MARPRERDAIRYPLDQLLGSQANVRLLRLFLYEVQAPLGASEAARRAGLTAAGARQSLKRLAQTGFVQRIGTGREERYVVREAEPLLTALRGLFQEEQLRHDAFMRALRDLFVGVSEVSVAWIEHAPATAASALEIDVVAEAKAMPWIGEELRSRLAPLEGRFDRIIELRAFTHADAPVPDPRSITLLAGALSAQGSGVASGPAAHSEREQRALRMSHGIARLLGQDPSMTKRAERHVDRLLREGQGTAAHDLLEWKQILETYSPERLREFLVSDSSRALRLRQSSPFFAILSPEERDALMTYVEEQR